MFISPMLAQKADQPYDDERIIAEPKMDGFRLILTTMDGVKAYTRHGNEVSARFPELKQASIPDGTVLDGELIVTNDQGRPDFELVMKRLQTRNPVKIQRLTQAFPVQYVVFDILYHRGKPVIDRPLMERKALLDEVVREDDIFKRIRFVEGNATGLFQVTGDAGLEGIVIKRKDAPYQPRKRSWSRQDHGTWNGSDRTKGLLPGGPIDKDSRGSTVRLSGAADPLLGASAASFGFWCRSTRQGPPGRLGSIWLIRQYVSDPISDQDSINLSHIRFPNVIKRFTPTTREGG